MVSLEDIHNFSKKLQKAYDNLESSPILEENKQLIKKFSLYLRRNNLKKATVINYIYAGKGLCEHLQELEIKKPITKLTHDDFDEFLIYMEDDKKVGKNTLRQYYVFLKKFSKFAFDDPPRWIRDLRVPQVKTRVQPSSLPTQKEFDEILRNS